MAQKITPPPAKTERARFMASEDSVLIKQITATHDPDGREINVKPILQIVQDILNSAATTFPDSALVPKTEAPEEKLNTEAVTDMLETLSYIINQLSCEISYKCMGGGDGHSTAVSLLNQLSSFSWDAKLVLTLAAFALNYGDFWLLAQIHSTNRLAGRMAILKRLPALLERSAPLKPQFDALNDLILSVVNLTRCVVQFTELPRKYISQDNSEYFTALSAFPLATYWIFRSLIACATNISYLNAVGQEYAISTTEAWELFSLTHKTQTMNEHLQKQSAVCQRYIEEKMNTHTYEALLSTFEDVYTDNMDVLMLLIYAKDDQLPLFEGTTKEPVGLDVLRRKTVLLLISGLDISSELVFVLEHSFSDHIVGEKLQYEVVWIPFVDRSTSWTESKQEQFESLRSGMSWYSVQHPSLISAAAIKFFKEDLHFDRKAVVAVLDPQGRIICRNALHKMLIWGSNAYPFTSSREEALWREETWSLELLIGDIDPTIKNNWIPQGKEIILYGSDDIEWIRRFIKVTGAAGSAANVPVEMVYAGNRTSKREQISEAMQVIAAEKLSHLLPDTTSIWFFLGSAGEHAFLQD